MPDSPPSSEPDAAAEGADREEFEVSPEEAILLSIRVHQEGRLMEARKLYRSLEEHLVDVPVLLHFSGVLEHQLGESDEAIRRIERAIELEPEDPNMWSNLGNVFYQTGRSEKAMAAYARTLELAPDHVNTLCNQGALLRTSGDAKGAETTLRKALELDPEHGESWHNLGVVLRSREAWDEAIDCFEKALSYGGYASSTQRATVQVVRILQATGRMEESVALLQDWVKRDPGDPVAQHMLAGATGENVPERASKQVVVSAFESFAEDFDEILLSKLDYKAPELVGRRVQELLSNAPTNLTICDAGCGTGLAGEFLRSYAGRLVGVDLSVTMLAKARQREIYDELVEDELTEFLDNNEDRFELITSVDTLCYIGELREVFEAAARALKASGWLVFTVEKAADATSLPKGYGLANHGRYHHSGEYMADLLGDAFVDIQMDDVVLRSELGEDVGGLLVSARLQ